MGPPPPPPLSLLLAGKKAYSWFSALQMSLGVQYSEVRKTLATWGLLSWPWEARVSLLNYLARKILAGLISSKQVFYLFKQILKLKKIKGHKYRNPSHTVSYFFPCPKTSKCYKTVVCWHIFGNDVVITDYIPWQCVCGRGCLKESEICFCTALCLKTVNSNLKLF